MNPFKFFRRSKPIPPLFWDYGHGFTARQLINGSWVLWDANVNRAVDLNNLRHSWAPDTQFFKECLGSRLDVHDAALDAMALRGVFKEKTK